MRSLSTRLSHSLGSVISALVLFLILSCAAPEVRDAGLGPDPSEPVVVLVSPDSATIGVNEPLQIQAQGRNANGEAISVESDWEATGGVVTVNGVFSSAVAGTFVVRAKWRNNPNKRDSSIVTVTSTGPTLTAVVVTPATASVAAGTTRQFSATGQLSDGSTTPVTVTWSATGGTISTNGLYTAGGNAGSFRVVATHQLSGLADTSTVTVTAAVLTQLTVSPANSTVLTGGTQQFSASGQLSDGSSTTPQVSYSATGGTITAGGLYTAGATTGAFRVIATEQGGTLADTATVNITAPAATLTQITLTPATANLVSGAIQQFAVTGQMSDGSTIVPAVTYSATGGTITAGGRYTAGGTAGSFRVIATQQGGTLADTSTITITVPPPVLTQVILTPATASVQAGATQQFAVSGQMSDGSSTTVQVTYAATGGTITAGGLYTAGSTGGSFRVIATQQGGTLADTSTVTVTAPLVLSQVVLTPASVSLVAGFANQQFTASGRMSDGSTTTVQVNYTATGGTITAGGLYTAGAAPGSFRVIATLQGGTLADTSTVTLTAPPVLTGVVVSPSTASVVTNASRQFTVLGQWSDGNTTPPPVTWTATGGTISTSGLYTAGGTTGSFRVIATVTGGILADTSTVTITAPPPPGTALFSSDWAGGLLDGGKWTRWGGNGVLAAVPPSGLGFPTGMANVLRVGMGTGTFDWVEANNQWTLPAIGESRAFRLYLRNDVGAVSGGWSATHPVESKGTDGSISGNFYAWHIGSNTGSTFPIAFGTSAGYPRNYISTSNTGSDVGTLQKGVTYRLEWKWSRTATNTYSLDMRITDPSGTIIENNSTMRAWGGSTLASNNTGFPIDAAFMTGIRIGINGGFSASGTQNVYWGGFAVCADWCGAYSSF